MEFKSYIVGSLQGSIGMLTYTLSDFTDADMFVRPCPGANHIAWQLGHMSFSEAGAHGLLSPAHAFAIPAGFKEVYNKNTHALDTPEAFAPFNTKAQLVEFFSKVRAATVACVESMTPEQFDIPTPEKYQSWAKTLGEMVALQAAHSMMHMGQFQVIRRKLGKPILF